MSLDVMNDSCLVESFEVNALDFDHSTVFCRCWLFLLENANGYLRTLSHSIDRFARELHRTSSAISDRRNPQYITNAKCSGFARSKTSSAGSSLTTVQILTMHYEKVLQPSPIHPATVVGNNDSLFLAVEKNPNN